MVSFDNVMTLSVAGNQGNQENHRMFEKDWVSLQCSGVILKQMM